VNLSRSFEGLLLQVCAESSDFNTWTWLKIVARSACKSFRKDLKVVRNFRKDRPSNLWKDSVGKL